MNIADRYSSSLAAMPPVAIKVLLKENDAQDFSTQVWMGRG